MLITYDREGDVLTIQLLDGAEEAGTVRLEPGVFLHRDTRGRIVELEILGASDRYPKEALEQLGSPAVELTLQEAAKESGLTVSTLRGQIHKERLTARHRGRDWVVTRAALWNYLENREARGRPAKKRKARRPKVRKVADKG